MSSVGKARSATSGGRRWRHRWQACLLLEKQGVPPVLHHFLCWHTKDSQSATSCGKRWRHQGQACLLLEKQRVPPVVAGGGATGGRCVFCWKSKDSGGKRWRHRWQVCLLLEKQGVPPVVASGGATGGKLVFCWKGKECHQWWQAVAPPDASLSFVGKARSATSGGKQWRHRWQACLLLEKQGVPPVLASGGATGGKLVFCWKSKE